MPSSASPPTSPATFSAATFSADVERYEREVFPNEYKEELGRLVEPLVERDLPEGLYVTLLGELGRHVSRVCRELGCTPPVWVEQGGGRSLLLSHLDRFRRDVRHRLVRELESLDVLSRPSNTVRDKVQYFYIPFDFKSTSARADVEGLLRDAHHALVGLYPLVERYVPNRQQLEQRVLHAAHSSRALSSRWKIERVVVGRPDYDARYACSPVPFHDVMIRQRDDGSRPADLTSPLHPMLTREAFVNNANVERVYANLTLHISAYARPRDGKGPPALLSFDYTPLVFTIELPKSARYAPLRAGGVQYTILPGPTRVPAMRPRQWSSFALTHRPNRALSAVWALIAALVERGGEEARTEARSGRRKGYASLLRELDRLVPDLHDWGDASAALASLRGADAERVRRRMGSSSALVVPTDELKRLPRGVEERVRREAACVRAERWGKKEVRLAAPLTETRWLVEKAQGGEVYGPDVLVDAHTALAACRLFVSALIASFDKDEREEVDVAYVSGESMHDAFY